MTSREPADDIGDAAAITGPPPGPMAASLQDIATVRAVLTDAREAAIAAFTATGRIETLFRQLTTATDKTVRALWSHAGIGADHALLAVGGYGRRELQPSSDVDLLIVTPDTPDDGSAERIGRFVSSCWDAGIAVGQSVRTVAQCGDVASTDITVMTSLLERRRLAGSMRLTARLDDEMRRRLDPADFLRHKMLEMQQRHHKFEDTPYALEPNVKESPGALRDLHLILWVARAAGLGRGWDDLLAAGVVEPHEVALLRRHAHLLNTIRAWLHILGRRREDRLVFDLQPGVAAAMGLQATGARAQSEALMQRYYLAAKSVTQLSTLLLQSFEVRLLGGPNVIVEPVDADFCRVGNLLDLRNPDGFMQDHRLVLKAFLMIQQEPGLTGMTSRTLRALLNAQPAMGKAFRDDPVNREQFLQILQAPRGVTHELRRMNQWSVLGRYLPTFKRIVGRMQHDLFHVYTVDQHILMVVRNLRRFMFAEHAHEYPLASELIAQFDRNWLLVLAALFHDIAKGRGGDHSQLGAVDADRFCRQHGLSRADRELVVFLVREHLAMSTTAQKQDIADPETIAAFAARVGTERRLVALYLLTVADIRGTSAKVWNGWKGKLLEDLFRRTRTHLAGETMPQIEQMGAVRTEAARLLLLRGYAPERYELFWKSLDLAYFLRHEPEDVAWHTRVLCDRARIIAADATLASTRRPRHRPAAAPVAPMASSAEISSTHAISFGMGRARRTALPMAEVHTRISPLGEGFELLVYTPDQPALFARICRFIERKGLSILEAWVHTTRAGRALDTFIIADPSGGTAYRDILKLIEVELAAALAQAVEVQSLAPAGPARMSRRSRAFPIAPKVELKADDGAQNYILTVTAMDRGGLLYDIARVLAQAEVDLTGARIATLGERVEDMFTLSGARLQSARRRVALERALLRVL